LEPARGRIFSGGLRRKRFSFKIVKRLIPCCIYT
jgi:hypothetical protein